MESFEFNHDRLEIAESKHGIPLYELSDCLVSKKELHPMDQLVEPGIIIRQIGSTITGTYPDGTNYFSFECNKSLANWKINNKKLYAYDSDGTIHVFPFDVPGVTTYPLTRKPHGWCIIPNTSTILFWNVLTLQAFDLDSTKHTVLREHMSKVIDGDASTSIAATGDHLGFLCIWFVASWKCHHNIKTGLEPCHQVRLHNDTEVAVRNDTKIEVYNVVTGKHLFRIKQTAKCIEWSKYGLVINTHENVIAYQENVPTICFNHKSCRLMKYVHDRIWTLRREELTELKLNDTIAEWPLKLIDWLKAPTFPVPSDTWPKRYLDVLAISAMEWIPKCIEWNPPKLWFRHPRLRKAIFDAVLHHELYSMAKQWSFLTNKTLWYSKCEEKLEKLVLNIDFSEKTVQLLRLCYKHVYSMNIFQWCWFHHGRQQMKPILMHMTKHPDFMNFVANKPSTQDSILCLTRSGVRTALRNGWYCIFIRWLIKYHEHYPHAPTHHMRQIFTELLLYTYTHLDSNTMDIPLEETGSFKCAEHITPEHTHAYIKLNNQKGFIKHVHCRPETPTEITWLPIHASTPLKTNKLTTLHIWTYSVKRGPRNMLECALTLLNEDYWTYQTTKKQWKWFKSEIGAFLCVNASIRIYDETMRIQKATFTENGGEFTTDSNFTVHESEPVSIEWLAPIWSYLESNLYHIIPLKLKICHALSISTRNIGLSTQYASELLQCCGTKAIQEEYEWRVKTYATAMISSVDGLFVGSKDGIIYEYNTVSEIDKPLRTFESHQQPIIQLELLTGCLVSLCYEQMNVWNLDNGTNIMSIETDMTFVSIILSQIPFFWVVEHNKRHPSITLWDIDTEIPVQRIDTSKYTSGTIFTSSIPLPTVIVGKTMYMLDNDEMLTLDVDNEITCIAGNSRGICGGTDSGNIFMVHFENNELTHWSAVQEHAVTAMVSVPESKLMITGLANGTLSVWDTEQNHFSMCISIGTSPIHCLFADSMFVMISCNHCLKLISIVEERAVVTVHALNAVIFWSSAWKTRILKAASKVLEPCITDCLLNNVAVPAAISLLDECTLEYHDRLHWCSSEFIDILLAAPLNDVHKILRRLASFRGPRFECAICGDDESDDSVAYIKGCQHRFHTGCIAELIRKVPEYNDEMRYEYALEVNLTCPTCRAPFKSEDVLEDTFLNKYLYIPYKQIKK